MAAALTGCKVEITTETPVKIEDSNSSATTTSKDSATARFMTYNIQYFSSEAIRQGDRINRLKSIVEEINPVVVGVQEVADRDAMNLLFAPDTWSVVIDDDSRDNQDVAFAVRKPWKVTNVPDDLDADDEQFLAESRPNETFFPNRRDALFVKVESPDGSRKYTVVNIHAKARSGGRSNSEGRRVGSSRILLEHFKGELKGQNIVLLGDFNDSPDDASLNVLETGSPNAAAKMESEPGEFMVNLTEPLWVKGMVTHGASDRRLDKKTGLVNNIYPEARQRNDNTRGRDAGSGPILFDQILVSKNLENALVGDAATIYRKPQALQGPGFSRPSDHLPVYIELK